MENDTITIVGVVTEVEAQVAIDGGASVVAEELLVEEISIDGMCGVY